jgi:signal transduction histidine kinase
LEKVRSRSLAMHKAEELGEVITVVFDKLKDLNFSVADGVALITFKEGSKDLDEWMANPGFPSALKFNLPYFEHPVLSNLWNAKNNGADFIVKRYTAEENKSFLHHIFEHSDFKHTPLEIKNYCLAADTYATSIAFQKRTAIFINDYSGNSLSEQEIEILKRFSKVFEQAYIRFLDLEKAESQAREAKIEAALEKVRSRSLAMHNTDELGEVVKVIVEKLQDLGVVLDANGVILCTYFQDSKDVLHWIVSPDFSMAGSYRLPYYDHPIFNAAWHSKLSGDEYFSKEFSVEEKNSFFEYAFEHSDYKHFPEEFKQRVFQNDKHSLSFAWQKNSAILIPSHTGVLPTEAGKAILIRFSKVFEQAYVRFLDLKKAEAQAREAKIEMALEKIRSRTMAMQHSDELPDAANLLFLEVQALGIPAWSCGYNVLAEDKKTSDCWMSSEGAIQEPFNLYFTEEASFIEWYNFLQSSEDLYIQELGGKRLEDHYNYMRNIPQLGEVLKKLEDAGISLPTYQINHLCKYTFGFLLFITYESVPDAHNIFKRFTKVFEQTYTRFLDLQKAEAQAREAKIETALEKVRSRTMAMQQSTELGEVASVLFKEMNQLVTNLWTCGFVLCEKYRTEDEWWLSMDAGFTRGFLLPNVGDYAHATLYEGWQTGEAFRSVELHGQLLQEHYDWLMGINISRKIFDEMDAAGLERPEWQKLHAAYFSRGYLCIITREPSEGEDIFKRFAQVFDLTYTRFLDLQKAEAQAKEAQVELSLERIRSKVTAMQESSELLDIVVAMRNEFVALGHEAHYFWHMRWLPEKYEKAMTSGDGSRIGMVMQLPRHMHGNIKLLAEWEKTNEPTVVYAMDAETAVDYVHKMITLGDFELVDPNAPTLDDIRHIGGLTFIMSRTTHGEIGYSLPGCVTDPPADGVLTIARFAGVFDLAYKRFEDLKTAEKDLIAIKAARLKAEEALAELQATQKQLVQQEKMASLGELTAGIAHEIQNPLNFVNNFSEVNEELMTELQDEARAGNTADVLLLATTIDENLKKIIHHGKRADSIVKGMLQHSRSDGGKKELTDINALADEFLRLSYHGLRAKDKTFNSVLETHFDPSIKPINIVPQEIGRVLLNLLNNAFYAVHEKKKTADNFEPTVSLSTAVNEHHISIKVKDNGNGIPEKLMDKIFQPFFTTKPTGEGTGLGLSLSYDIVKAHGGELKVETKEGDGSEFIIQFPTN